MAAIDMSLVARSEVAVQHLMKRKNWAAREPGVILVFAIVGAVVLLLIGLFIQKKVSSSQLALCTCSMLTELSRFPPAKPPPHRDTPWQRRRWRARVERTR